MAERNNYINGSIEYQLKYYQMMRELETFREKDRKEQEEKAKQDSQDSSTDSLEDKEGEK
jgi:hypothetical protein